MSLVTVIETTTATQGNHSWINWLNWRHNGVAGVAIFRAQI